MVIATALALLLSTPAEDFLRGALAPCGFGGKDIAPEAIYEPDLAALAKRVAELAPDTLPNFKDADIRRCGGSPEKPVNSVKTVKTSDGKVTVIADTGTVAMNNRAKQTYVLVETPAGWRVSDAIYKSQTLRGDLTRHLAELTRVAAQRDEATNFVRRVLEEGAKPGEEILGADLGTEAPKRAKVASVTAGLSQAGGTLVTAKLADGSARHFVVTATPAGPRIWDEFGTESRRVATADKATMAGALPITDAEAVAFIRAELGQFIKPTKGHKQALSDGLHALMAVDGQLTEGVPYVNGDIVCGCQDYEKFSIESVKADKHDGARVHVIADFHVFQDARSARHQTFVVVKTKQGLQIDDVVDGEGSLRAALTQSIARGYVSN